MKIQRHSTTTKQLLHEKHEESPWVRKNMVIIIVFVRHQWSLLWS